MNLYLHLTLQKTKYLFNVLVDIVSWFVFSLIYLWQKTRFIRSLIYSDECRFYPSCSEYSCTAIRKYGLVKGIMLSFKRLFKCHPLYKGGIDEVPEKG